MTAHIRILLGILGLSLGLGQTASGQTYWLGRSDGDKLVFDVKAPDAFVTLMKTKTAVGGMPFTRTVKGTKYTFYKQLFTWDEGDKSHPRGEYQQIRVDDKLEPFRDGEKWHQLDFKTEQKLTNALYGLKKRSAPDSAWYHVDALVVETAGADAPGLTIAAGATAEGTPFELGVAELAKVEGEDTAHEKCPQYTAFTNDDGTIDVVWQEVSGKKIHVTQVNPFKNTVKPLAAIDSLGLTAGAARSSKGEFYIATAERHKDQTEAKQIKVVAVTAGGKPRTLWSNTVYAPLKAGSARLALAEDAHKLLAVFNLKDAHSHYALISTQAENQATKAHETMWHHNFDQRAVFDGSDFVILEKRDHDVSVTLMKVSPAEKSPEKNGEWQDRLRSVHPTTNWGNSTFTELGQVVPGLDGGYLVLFASERDWDYKMGGGKFAPDWGKKSKERPIPAECVSPRDLAAVHVVKDFDKQDANWRDVGGKWFTQSPGAVSTAGLVNSTGTGKTVKYKTADDGWDWPSYTGQDPPKDLAALAKKQGRDEGAWRDTEREFTTQGLNWLTGFGEAAEAGHALSLDGKEFTAVQKPKVVPTGDGKYLAVWEEHTCTLKQHEEFLQSNYKHLRTQAATITLTKEGDKVKVTRGEPVTLKDKPRLHWQDDAFAFNGGLAWITGDSGSRALVLHQVDPNGEYHITTLALP
jgi:hypothetical protein